MYRANGNNPHADCPFARRWKLQDPEWLESLDLPAARSAKYAKAREAVVIEAVLTSHTCPGVWLSYPRRKAAYAQSSRYRDPALSFAYVPDAVDELERLGLIEHQRARPGQLGFQSRFRASDKLAHAPLPPNPQYDPGEVIRLRGEDGRLVNYRDTAATERMRKEIHKINDTLRKTAIGVSGHPVIYDLVQFEGIRVPLRQKLYHRQFNDTFSLGGRIYGPWWQWAPSGLRQFITINGQKTHEHDYGQFHPTLLYALAGEELDGSAYEIPGFRREDAKLAFQILINAETENSALAALRDDLSPKPEVGKYARTLYEAMRKRHAPIARFFVSGVGSMLQRHDGDLIVRIHMRLLREGASALSVHDSVLVAERHRAIRDEIMADELDRLLWDLRQKSSKYVTNSVASSKTVPQKGRRAVPPPLMAPRSLSGAPPDKLAPPNGSLDAAAPSDLVEEKFAVPCRQMRPLRIFGREMCASPLRSYVRLHIRPVAARAAGRLSEHSC